MGKFNLKKVRFTDDLEFELELIKQVEVNIDYILMLVALVAKYQEGNCEDKEILAKIRNNVSASPQLRSKKELIEGFIESINIDSVVDRDRKSFVAKQEKEDLETIIKEENLKEEETKKFVSNAFRNGAIKENGTNRNHSNSASHFTFLMKAVKEESFCNRETEGIL